MNLIEKDTKIVGMGRDIIFVDGKYYLISYSPAKVCISENLKDWEEYELNSKYLNPKSIAYGNGHFVITGDAGSTNDTFFYTSDDGKNWIPIKINTSENFSIHSNSVKFINNRFIALLGIYWYKIINGTKITTKTENWFFESFDGKNWKKNQLIINSEEELSHMDIDFYNGTYIRVGYSGSIFTSQNLNDWTRQNSGTSNMLTGICHGKGKIVISGDNGTILTSSDGKTWQINDIKIDDYLCKTKFYNGTFFVVGYNGKIIHSIDAENWQITPFRGGGAVTGLTYDNINNRIIISLNYYKIGHTIPILLVNLTRNLTDITDDDSSLFFFDKNLKMLGIIDYFISLRWRRKYFEAGEFEIVLPVNEYTKKILNTDILVMRNNYSEAGIIETIQFNDDGDNEEVTLSGRFLSSLLDRRIIKNKIVFSGQTIEAMNTIVNNMTPLTPLWETEQVSMSSKNISFQATYKNVYDYICKLSSYSNIGVRIVPNVDSKVYMFETWKGLDRTYNQTINPQYSFSDDNYNIEKGSLIISNKTKANYALIGGTGEDTARITTEISDGSSGLDLHEIFVDQKGLSNKDIDNTTYIQQLKDAGASKLSEGTFKLEVNATNIGDYKSKWDLGDIVNIKKEKWGIYTTYRIIEVEEIIEDGKKTIYPTFGSPLSQNWKDD